MQAQNFVHILIQACVALTLFTTMVSTAACRLPADHNPPPSSHGSDQTITLYTTGSTPPNAGAPSLKHPIFINQGPISHSGSWLRALTRPGVLRPGTVTVVDGQFHGKREYGLPLAGKLQGILVTSFSDNSSRMVVIMALFSGNGAKDSLRFFGVHHDGQEESHIAVVGGTGRYDGATGFVVVRAAEGENASFSRVLGFRVHLKLKPVEGNLD